METTPMHPVIDAGSKPKPTITPLESWRIAEVKAAGGGRDDLRALCFAKIGQPREKLHRFILHFHRHGAAVLRAFEELADEAVKKGFPERLGCETLSATARFMHPAFPLSNNERPGYVIALRIKRPDLAGMLDAETDWPLALLRAGWNPWREEAGE
jgi:hypothetical protein